MNLGRSGARSPSTAAPVAGRCPLPDPSARRPPVRSTSRFRHDEGPGPRTGAFVSRSDRLLSCGSYYFCDPISCLPAAAAPMTPTAMRARAQIGRTGACEPSPAGTADGTVAAVGADTPAAEPATPAETEPGAGTFTGFLAGALAGAGTATVAGGRGQGRGDRGGLNHRLPGCTRVLTCSQVPNRTGRQRGSGRSSPESVHLPGPDAPGRRTNTSRNRAVTVR